MLLNEVLNKCRNEKDVENVYRTALSKIFKTDISSPYATDGVLRIDSIHCLLEFKLHTNLNSGIDRAKVLIQCLYYLKKYEVDGKSYPTTIFVGDVNECFVISTTYLINNYINRDLNWSIAPSTAYVNYPDLVIEMSNDNNLLAYIFNKIETDEVKQKIIDLSSGTVRLIPINSKNIIEIFRIFNDKVLVDKFDTQKTAALFIECLINHKDIYLHPKKKNLLITSKYGEIKIKSDNYTTFFNHFKQEYTPAEAKFITEQKDRLVEETVRRKTGEFFTPPIWVAEAHKEIAKNFGDDWREKYIVWDNSCGTGNLTRDYRFNNLFMSTLNQEDIDIIKTMSYNKGATLFQFDFLNDEDDKIPVELLDNSKELLILMNPPYGTQASADSYKTKGKRTDGIKTKIAEQMNKNKMKHAAKQLYCQFIYRLIILKNKYNLNMKIGMFCPEGFVTKSSYKEFRKLMYDNFEFKSGFVFEASEFADVIMKWPIAFTIWENK